MKTLAKLAKLAIYLYATFGQKILKTFKLIPNTTQHDSLNGRMFLADS